MEISTTIISIVSLGIGCMGYITAAVATKRIKTIEHQLVDIKLAATKIISLEQQIADLKSKASGSE